LVITPEYPPIIVNLSKYESDDGKRPTAGIVSQCIADVEAGTKTALKLGEPETQQMIDIIQALPANPKFIEAA
jgi:hypothetical protein